VCVCVCVCVLYRFSYIYIHMCIYIFLYITFVCGFMYIPIYPRFKDKFSSYWLLCLTICSHGAHISLDHGVRNYFVLYNFSIILFQDDPAAPVIGVFLGPTCHSFPIETVGSLKMCVLSWWGSQVRLPGFTWLYHRLTWAELLNLIKLTSL
jgi:hypothetical protein